MSHHQNWKFFQIKQMTKQFDPVYEEEHDELKRLHLQLRHEPVNLDDPRIQIEREILQEWEDYKLPEIKRIINETHNQVNPQYKMCICDFAQERRLSMELWMKICFDIFNDELDGNHLRFKFWTYLRQRSWTLKDDLMTKTWPEEWRYFEDDPCLCIEIVKIYEQYPPMRWFIARNLNQLGPKFIAVDVRRLPLLTEDKGLEIDYIRRSWFPRMTLCSSQQLERLYYANSIFTQQILQFIINMKDIVWPILRFFDERQEGGTVLNLYGDEVEFMFEVIYSMKAACGLSMRVTEGSLKIQKVYKGNSDQRTKEEMCRIVLTTMSQADINEEVLKDIYQNVQQGYACFKSEVRSYVKPSPKMVVMVSERKLNVKMPRADDIYYHAIPDTAVRELLKQFDYRFLMYYTNLLFGKVMVVQQTGGQRKPFYQIMLLMWSYVLPLYFGQKNPELVEDEIFKLLEAFEQKYKLDRVEIPLDEEEEEYQQDQYEMDCASQSEHFDHEKYPEVRQAVQLTKKVKLLKFEDEEKDENEIQNVF